MRKRDVKEKPKYYRLKLYNVRLYQKKSHRKDDSFFAIFSVATSLRRNVACINNWLCALISND